MLTPEQVAAIRDRANDLTKPITDYLLQDIARRISEAGQLTSSASYQIYRAQQLGLSRKEIEKELKRLLKVGEGELKTLLTQSAEVGYRFDLSNFGEDAVPFEENEVIQQIVGASVQLATDDFKNITQTLGMVDPHGNVQPLHDAYQKCMDFAYSQVATGATDYNTAIRNAVKNLSKYGVRSIDYESGVHRSLEAATRGCVMGGLGLMQEQISQQNHDDMGADGWEISAHAASAPDHEPIQGKQYSDKEYTALNNSLIRRIGTLNCGHAAYPIILGVSEPQYSEEELEELRQQNEEGITFEGKHYTMYEATQTQRRLERAMRSQKRKILLDEAIKDDERLLYDQIRLHRINEEYVRFSRAADLPLQRERAQVIKYGRGHKYSRTNMNDLRLKALDYSRQRRLSNHPELALPNAKNAIISDEKFSKYLFNPENKKGYDKGVAFSKRLGYNENNWRELKNEIQERSILFPATSKGDNGYGMAYEQKMILYGKTKKPTNVVVAWIIENGNPRLTSAYIKEVEKSGH